MASKGRGIVENEAVHRSRKSSSGRSPLHLATTAMSAALLAHRQTRCPVDVVTTKICDIYYNTA